MEIIPLDIAGEGITLVDLGEPVTLVHRFNYSASCWTLDILDTTDTALITGVMLVPNADLLKGHEHLKDRIGSLAVYEKTEGDYMVPGKLSDTVLLMWWPVGEKAIVP